MLDLFGNRFSHNEAHFVVLLISLSISQPITLLYTAQIIEDVKVVAIVIMSVLQWGSRIFVIRVGAVLECLKAGGKGEGKYSSGVKLV